MGQARVVSMEDKDAVPRALGSVSNGVTDGKRWILYSALIDALVEFGFCARMHDGCCIIIYCKYFCLFRL